MREAAKWLAHMLATVAVTPVLLSYVTRRLFLGSNRAFEGSSQTLALLPGMIGSYLRRAFLARVLTSCERTVTVEFGVLFSDTAAVLDANVYVGPRCHLGRVHLERDVMLGAGVHVPSGGATHGTADVDRPIREQPGAKVSVRIGEGTWVGSAAVIMADVGKHCVIGAGAVVTRPLPDYVVAAGVPARVLKVRQSGPPGA